ncbi:MAG: DNA alkylation repair protein [Oscillospiraceae bacterium]|nr:DNA alkylation repair protein [Oscillospiraceae bacterium]
MRKIEKDIRERLFAMQDTTYRDFQKKLIPNIAPEKIIGVRMPELRKLARVLSGTPDAEKYIASLPHGYYDENNLHGLIIERMRDYDAALAATEAFLPYVDNWATCDIMSPKVFKKRPDEFYETIKAWTASGKPYTVRFGIEMLMSFYLDDNFREKQHEIIAQVQSEKYYVNMMRAWYFATALAKRYEETVPFIEERRLDKWTHNKTIQKAVESYRITDEQKAYLRTLKIK